MQQNLLGTEEFFKILNSFGTYACDDVQNI